jgi:4-hydroxybenzoate polyprenyltransferase
LNAVATVVVASIAGGSTGVVTRLGLAMLGMQFAIGAANDFSDASSDAVSKVGKPIPAGQISRRTAATVAAVAAGLGLLMAASAGTPALIVGFVGLGDGFLYDLRLKGTALAWAPFAAGVGLLPVYAWWGAVGSVPPAFPGIVVLAFFAGVTLALANAYADLDRDRASATSSVATFLGRRPTLVANAGLLACVQIVAVATTGMAAGAVPLLWIEMAGCGLGWLGIALAGVSDDRAGPLAWEVQAVGMAVLGGAWLAVLSGAGLLHG